MTTKTPTKKLVTERALAQRAARIFAKEDMVLRKCREYSRDWSNLGDYYTVDISTNCVAYIRIDLTEYLRPYEQLAD